MTDDSLTPDQSPTTGEPDAGAPRASGSRWEPDPAGTAGEPVTAQLSEPVSDDPVPGYSPTAPEPTAGRLRARLGLAAAAVGLVTLGGAGGFVLGHATAGDPMQDLSQRGGFPGGVPGGGGRPEFGEGHHDHDHEGFEHDGFDGPQDQPSQPGSTEGSGADT